MDKMVYLAMSGAKQVMHAQAKNAHNLANANTTGFRADLAQFRAMPVYGEGLPSRAFALQERPGYRFDNGAGISTGNDLDIAVKGEGWIAVIGSDGTEAYTRRGDLKINANGLLENGAGHLVLGNGGPIAFPPLDTLDIASDGTISYIPRGAEPNAIAVLDRIKLVRPNNADLEKNAEGLFVRKDRGIEPPDAAAQVESGTLEGSNVNAIEELVEMISLSRQFEIQIKMMRKADENSQAMERLLQFGS